MDLKKILADHLEWLKTGKGGSANLSYANLSYADLRSANLFYCIFLGVKWDESEIQARKLLKSKIPPEEFERYINYGFCFIEGAMFGLMEWVNTPQGWYCTVIQSPETLPPSDRMLHRIYLWRKSKEEFYKIAKQQL